MTTSDATSSDAVVELTRVLPAYEIQGELGRGGCGIVYAAIHRKLGRRVAIKQIPRAFANDVSVRRRFAGEARLMSAINHPHVMPVYDYLEIDDICVLVGEYLPGGTVGDRFSSRGFDAQTAIAVALSAAAGLQAAHDMGVLHRDVKPGNLIFAASGSVKLTDFGIAKILGGTDTLVTRAGDVIGTPAYIAPEQARGEDLSPATDIYALGTMLYELLSGTLPFPVDQNPLMLLHQHAYEPPRPLLDVSPNAPAALADVVMGAITTDVGDRYSSAEEFGIALGESATECWGEDWLTETRVQVVAAEPVMSAATGRSSTVRSYRSGHDSCPETPARQRPPTRELPRVQPASERPPDGVSAVDVAPTEVRPTNEVVRRRSSTIPNVVAAVLVAGAFVCALVGLGSQPAWTNPGPHEATVIDAKHATDPLVIQIPPGTGGRLTVTEMVAGLAVAHRDVPYPPAGNTQTVAAPLPGWVLPSPTDASLRSQHYGSASERFFQLHRDGSRYLTAFTLGTAVLTLFSAAYVESNTRTLRQGRSRGGGVIGLVSSAIVFGLCLPAWAWIVLGHPPTRATVLAAAALSAGAAVSVGVGALRAGHLHRYRRAARAGRPTAR